MKGLSFVGAAALAAASLLAVLAPIAAAGASAPTGTQFYVPRPNPAAQQQIAQLKSSGHKADAALVNAMMSTAHAVWITGGTPKDARLATLQTVDRAARKNQVPVFAL